MERNARKPPEKPGDYLLVTRDANGAPRLERVDSLPAYKDGLLALPRRESNRVSIDELVTLLDN
jgi:hypothetical protein